MHEHVFIMTTEIAQNYPEAWGVDKRWPAIARLERTQGPRRGHHRRPHGDQAGPLHPAHRPGGRVPSWYIVVATGVHHNDVPFYFHYLGPKTAGRPGIMTDMFVRDIEHGIAVTRHQGEVSSAPPTNPASPWCRAGVARVLKHTNAPGRRSPPHAGLRRDLDQQRIFIGGGGLSQVVIGHCGVGCLEELIAAGSYLRTGSASA